MDQLQAIRMFVRVVDAGSFTQAADSLQLPRSSVSTAIQRLERHLETRLIHRTTRSMRLTEEGATYLAWCRRLLDELEDIEGQFRQSAAQPSGRLRVDVPSRIGRRVIAPALPDFFSRYPEIELSLGATDRPVDLIQEATDCAIRVGTVRAPQLIARRLGFLRQVNCASPDYLARHGRPRSPAALSRHLAVHYASPVNGRVDDFEYQAGRRLHRVPMRSLVTVNNAETYIACCLAGLGIIQIPAYDVAERLADGSLVEILPACAAPPLPISLVYPPRRHRLPRVQAFSAWVGTLFAGLCEPAGPPARRGSPKSRSRVL